MQPFCQKVSEFYYSFYLITDRAERGMKYRLLKLLIKIIDRPLQILFEIKDSIIEPGFDNPPVLFDRIFCIVGMVVSYKDKAVLQFPVLSGIEGKILLVCSQG